MLSLPSNHYLFNCIIHLPVLFNSLIAAVKNVVLSLPENQEANRRYTVIRTFVREHATEVYKGNGSITPLILKLGPRWRSLRFMS
jgi:hypothetical protein